MLSKFNRLPSSEFDNHKAKSKIFQGKYFGVSYYKSHDTSPTRFGFIISSKIAKKAVIRNSIKRHMAEVIRKNFHKIRPGHEVVFLAKKSITDLTPGNLESETLNCMSKIGAIK